jgi:hypothetical protein
VQKTVTLDQRTYRGLVDSVVREQQRGDAAMASLRRLLDDLGLVWSLADSAEILENRLLEELPKRAEQTFLAGIAAGRVADRG